MYLSATPYAQGHHLLYNQFALSEWSPFSAYPNPYDWHRAYGIPDIQYLGHISFETYKKTRGDEIDMLVQHLFVRATRKDLEFKHEPKDKLHYVKLSEPTTEAYNQLMKHRLIEFEDGEVLACDSPMKLRTALHMLEGGVAKIEENYRVLKNQEKIDYILEHWGDNPNLVIMHNYKAEKTKLEAVFKQARILQATSFAEGVDLSQYNDLIIYSQDFSTARHSQRRARQANKNRVGEIVVHFLLVEHAISAQVYNTVSVNKVNFIDALFAREYL